MNKKPTLIVSGLGGIYAQNMDKLASFTVKEVAEVTKVLQKRKEFSQLYEDAPEPYIAPHKPLRNWPCPCGSGVKYKKCCLYKPNES